MIINPGATATFRCGVKGTPTPEVIWGKGGDTIVSDDRTSVQELDTGDNEDILSELTLSNVDAGDEGLYWCNASSGFYRSSAGAQLVVIPGPVTSKPPTLPSAQGEDLEIVTPPAPLTINPGATATFRCGVKGTPTPEVIWGKGDDIISVDSRTSIEELDPGEQEDVLSELTLRNVQVDDGSMYWCNASSGLYRSSAGAELAVFGDPVTLEPPTMSVEGAVEIIQAANDSQPVVTPQSIVATMGQARVIGIGGYYIEIECPANGDPPPTIEWQKDGSDITDDKIQVSAEGTLQIRKFSSIYAGTYTCIASNERSSDQESIEVLAAIRPQLILRQQPPSPDLPLQDIDVRGYAGHSIMIVEGQMLTMDAEATGRPTPWIVWRLPDGRRLGAGESDGRFSVLANYSLVVTDIRVTDSGTYRAIANNGAGLSKLKGPVTVVGKPKVIADIKDSVRVAGQRVVPTGSGEVSVATGSRFSLSGSVSGATTLSWRKDGDALAIGADNRYSVKRISSEASQLTVKDFRASDAGEYALVGSNDAGNASSSVRITTAGADAPRLLRMPSQAPQITSDSVEVWMGRQSVMVTRGQALRIWGSAEGRPLPTYQWTRDGVPLTSGGRVSIGSDGLLEIRRFRSSDGGEYRVIASNSAGSDNETIDILLPEHPVITIPPYIGPSPQPDLDMEYLAGQNAQIYQGRNLRLGVIVSGRPTPRLTWRLPSGRRLKAGTSYDRYSVHGNGLLEVKDVRVSDEGTYRAIASNMAGLGKAKSRLSVLVSPSFRRPLQQSVFVDGRAVTPSTMNDSVSVTAGRAFVIEASLDGKPSPSVSWTFNGAQITSGGRKMINTSTVGLVTVSRLTVSDAMSDEANGNSDSGTYSVQTDGVLSSSDTVDIVVEEEGNPRISRLPNYQETVRGSRVITSIGRPEIVFVPGETVEVRASASGDPAPSLQWTRGSTVIGQTGQSRVLPSGALEVSNVRDEATYTLTATNQKGSDQESISFIRATTPRLRIGPDEPDRDPLPDKDLTYTLGQRARIRRGKTLTIEAQYEGRPLPNIFWMLPSGRRLKVGEMYNRYRVMTNGALVIRDSMQRDTGSYRIIASNRAGQDIITTPVKVVEPVTVSFDPEDNMYVDDLRVVPSTAGDFVLRSGSKLSILFGANGVAARDIRWTKDGAALPFDEDARLSVMETSEGSRLSIRNTNQGDSGSYVGEATKDGEVATASVDIRVAEQNAPLITRRADFASEVTDSDVKTSIAQLRVFITAGKTLTLTSEATGTPQPVISWYKDGTQLMAGGDVSFLSDGSLQVSNFQAEDSGTYQSRATIGEQVDIQDTEVDLAESPFIPEPAVRPPQRPLSDSDQSYDSGQAAEVVAGRSVSVSVPAMGSPRPRISWLLPSGRRLSSGESYERFSVDEAGRLQIRKAESGDSGDYTTIASNTAGKSTRVSRVTVFGSPRIVRDVEDNVFITGLLEGDRRLRPSQSSGNFIVRPGTSIALEGSASGQPIPVLRFLKDGEFISTEGRFSVEPAGNGGIRLAIEDVTTVENGTYTLVAENEAGFAGSSVTIIVDGSSGDPFIDRKGGDSPTRDGDMVKAVVGRNYEVRVERRQTLALEVSFSGNEPFQIDWTRNGRSVSMDTTSSSSNTLVLNDFHKSLAGTYVVTVSNMDGSDSEQIEVIYDAPVRPRLRDPEGSVPYPAPDRDVSYTAGQSASAIQGRTVRILASATGSPAPSIRWRLPNGKRIGVGQSYGRARVMEDYTLVLENVQPKNNGKYRAIASNIAGLDKAKSQLSVIVPPQFSETIQSGIRVNDEPTVAHKSGVLVVEAESDLSLRCAASGTPTPVLRFLRDGSLVNSGIMRRRSFATLTINNIQDGAAGTYSCVAENVGGAATSTVDVVVARPGAARLVRRVGVAPRISSSEAVIPLEYGRISMARGMKLTLTASAVGTPIPILSWYKNGKLIRNDTRFLVGNDGSLVIRKFSSRDAGTYEVRAVNSAGQDSNTIEVQLGDRPQFSRRQSITPPALVPDTDRTFSPGQLAQVIRGRTVTFVVGVLGNPAPYVSWRLPSGRRLGFRQTYDRFSVAENGDLRISNVNSRDSGKYQVFAYNFAGMDKILSKQETQLTVYDPVRLTTRASDSVMINGRRTRPSTDGVLIVNPGSSLSLECSADSFPPADVNFQKDGSILISGWRIGITTTSSGRRRVTVSDVEAADEGRYLCVATNRAGADSSFVDVVVQEGARIDREIDAVFGNQRSFQVQRGQEVSMICNATGDSELTVEWLRFGQAIGSSGRVRQTGRVLEIDKVENRDVGSYTCVARDSAGEDRESIDLMFGVKPSIQRSEPSPIQRPLPASDRTYVAGQIASIVEGQTVVVAVPIVGDPVPSVRWILPDSTVLRAGESRGRISVFSNGSLTVENVRFEDRGLYQVRASSLLGVDSVNTPIRVVAVPESDITVVIPPSPSSDFVMVDDAASPLTLEVDSGAVQDSSIVWTKDGERIGSGRRLVVSSVGSGGVFTATVENDAGSAADSVDVRLADTGVPFITRSPDVQPVVTPGSVRASIGVPDVSVSEGQTLTILVPIRGSPTPDVSWYRNGEPIITGEKFSIQPDGSLEITDVSSDDAGSYTVSITNDVGVDEETMDVTVPSSPAVQRQPSAPQDFLPNMDLTYSPGNVPRIINGRTLTLTFPVSGQPLPDVTWQIPSDDILRLGQTRGRLSVLTDGSLRIRETAPSDSGNYVAVSSSTAGGSRQSYSVRVVESPRLTESRLYGSVPAQPDDSGNVYLYRGSTVGFICRGVALTHAAIHWTKDGEAVQSRGRFRITESVTGAVLSSTLELSDGQFDDAGIYTCTISSLIGADSQSFNIIVVESMVPVINRQLRNDTFTRTDDSVAVRVGPQQILVAAGESLTVNCDARGQPDPVITWRKGESQISSSGRVMVDARGALIIMDYSQADEGDYTCVATNRDESDSESIRVLTATAPEILRGRDVGRPRRRPPKEVNYDVGFSCRESNVAAGGTVTFTCNAPAQPSVDLTWTLPSGRKLRGGETVDNVFVDRDGVLRLSNAGEDDGGVYTCEVKNYAGTDSEFCILEVAGQCPHH
jgi:hemicentin